MDQVEVKVVDPVDEKQVPNRFETGFSAQQAALRLQEIVEGWDKQTRPVQLLLALCRLVADSDSAKIDGFSAIDLVDAVQKAGVTTGDGQGDPENFRKWVSRNWNKLEEIWTERRPGVIQRFRDSGLDLNPELERREGGGRTHPTLYFLKFAPGDSAIEESLDPQVPVPADGVRYYTEEIRPAQWLNWLASRGYPLVGWRANVFVGAVMTIILSILAILLIIWFGVIWAPTTVKSISSVLSLGLVAAGAWFLMRPFVELINNRVALAPWWMQGAVSGHEDRLVELRRKDDIGANAICLTRYSGKCPLCGGNVLVSSGRREFHGRLVGRCGQAPNEHVFSFDPVLRIGKPLR